MTKTNTTPNLTLVEKETKNKNSDKPNMDIKYAILSYVPNFLRGENMNVGLLAIVGDDVLVKFNTRIASRINLLKGHNKEFLRRSLKLFSDRFNKGVAACKAHNQKIDIDTLKNEICSQGDTSFSWRMYDDVLVDDKNSLKKNESSIEAISKIGEKTFDKMFEELV